MASKSRYNFGSPYKSDGGWTKSPPIQGLSIDKVWIDELDAITNDHTISTFEEQYMTKQKAEELGAEVTARLTKLAEGLIGYFKDVNPTVRLYGPNMLTVKVPAGGYKKVSHIGGEEFQVDSVYLGKKGKLIFAFNPVVTAAYTQMEMDADDALAGLEHFRNAVDAAVGGDFVQEVTAIRRLEADAREAAASADKFTEYEDIGFGSW